MDFSVCFTGQLRSGFKKKSVQEDFSDLFHLTDKKSLKRIFSASSPILIRKNMTLPDAEIYLEELHNIGMQAIIVDAEGQPLQKVTQAVAPKEEVIETVAPKEEIIEAIAPKEEVIEAIAPKEEIIETVAPKEEVIEAEVSTGKKEPLAIIMDDVEDEDEDEEHTEHTEHTECDHLSLNSCTISSPIHWLLAGFTLFKRAPSFYIVTMLLWIILLMCFSFMPTVGQFFSSLFSGIMYAFLVVAAHQLSEGDKISFSTVMDDLNPNIVRLLILNILYSISVAGAMFSAFFIGGDNIIMVAGIATAMLIIISMAFWLAPILMVVHHVTILEALVLSARGCFHNILPFILYALLAMILLFVSIIPAGLGLLVAIPVTILAMYQACNEIFVLQ